jgi:hypothetical protein
MMTPVNWPAPNDRNFNPSYLSQDLRRFQHFTCYQPPVGLQTIFRGSHESSKRISMASNEIQRQLPVLMQENTWLKQIYVASDSQDDMYEAVRRFEIFSQATVNLHDRLSCGVYTTGQLTALAGCGARR